MRKYIAIASKEGKIAEYLTNGKSYPIIGFYLDKNNKIKKSIEYGRFFYIKSDHEKGYFCLEKKCSHLNGKNWKIKEIKKSNFRTHLSDYLNRHNIDKAEFILYCGMAFLALIWLLGAITKAFI